MQGWRRWLIALVVGFAAGGATWGVLTFTRPEASCACTGAPYLDQVDETAARWIAAVSTKDTTTAWGMLTLEAQQRRGDVDKFEAELPALATRFRAAQGAVWQEAYVRTQGYGTPSVSVLVLVAPDPAGLKAVSALVVHSEATRDDPGRVDPDLGETLQMTPVEPALVRIANAAGTGLRFAALAQLGDRPVPLRNTGTGGGLYRLELPTSAVKPEKAVLVLAAVVRPDGKYSYGAATVTFRTAAATTSTGVSP